MILIRENFSIYTWITIDCCEIIQTILGKSIFSFKSESPTFPIKRKPKIQILLTFRFLWCWEWGWGCSSRFWRYINWFRSTSGSVLWVGGGRSSLKWKKKLFYIQKLIKLEYLYEYHTKRENRNQLSSEFMRNFIWFSSVFASQENQFGKISTSPHSTNLKRCIVRRNFKVPSNFV